MWKIISCRSQLFSWMQIWRYSRMSCLGDQQPRSTKCPPPRLKRHLSTLHVNEVWSDASRKHVSHKFHEYVHSVHCGTIKINFFPFIRLSIPRWKNVVSTENNVTTTSSTTAARTFKGRIMKVLFSSIHHYRLHLYVKVKILCEWKWH